MSNVNYQNQLLNNKFQTSNAHINVTIQISNVQYQMCNIKYDNFFKYFRESTFPNPRNVNHNILNKTDLIDIKTNEIWFILLKNW